MKNLKILVTDGENRSSLAITRSLGATGHKIFVSSKRKQSISGSSKFCFKRFQVTDPSKNIAQYQKDISALVKDAKIDVIIPMTEATIYALNEIREKLTENCILACPEQEKFDAISDKFALFKQAKKLGVNIPVTIFVGNKADLRSKIDAIQNYPVVIKPGKSKIKKDNSYISASVAYAQSRAELINLYDSIEVLNYPSMIQEKIEGPGTGFFTLFDKDKHLAKFSHKRLREKPPSGGVSVVCESVPIDGEMELASKKLLSSVDWQGVAMVEFKRDLKDGKAKLMEINGRFWGSLQLAIASGVNFPVLIFEYLFGSNKLEEAIRYTSGVKLKWLLGTLDHLVIRLKNSTTADECKPKVGALTEFLKIYDTRTTYDVFSCDDIQPFWTELKQYVKDLR